MINSAIGLEKATTLPSNHTFIGLLGNRSRKKQLKIDL